MLCNDIDTKQSVSRQREMAHLSHYTNAYYWSDDGYLSGAVYPNVMMPGYGGSNRAHAGAGQWESRLTQCKATRHAHNYSQLRSCMAAGNSVDLCVLKNLSQHDGYRLHDSRFSYGYPINGYGYERLIGSAEIGFADEAQVVADAKTVCQFDALSLALFDNSHSWKVLPTIANVTTTALDNR